MLKNIKEKALIEILRALDPENKLLSDPDVDWNAHLEKCKVVHRYLDGEGNTKEHVYYRGERHDCNIEGCPARRVI